MAIVAESVESSARLGGRLVKIRPLDKNSRAEIALVASRMRDTLIEAHAADFGQGGGGLGWSSIGKYLPVVRVMTY
jgi:hypothetical protein